MSATATAANRFSDLERRLAELGCDGALVLATSARDPDMAPFTGAVHVHGCFLAVPRDGAPRLGYLSPMERDEAARSGLALLTPEDLDVARWARGGAPEEELLAGVLEQGLPRADLAPGATLALAGHVGAGVAHAVAERLQASGWRFVPGHEMLLRLRQRKTADEIGQVRRAAAAALSALRGVAALLASAGERDGELWLGGERLRAGRLRAEIAARVAEHGCEQPEGNIVAAGADAGVPHTAGADERALRPGEPLVVDLYPKAALFADCTRTFCVGAAPEALVGAHAAVLEALRAAHVEAVAGARGWDLQQATCERLGAHGWPTPLSDPGTTRGYVHGLGHGVGFELHEYPSFRRHAGDEGVLGVGDVFTLEPGLYDPEAGLGVRLEDLVVLGEDGPQNLTPLPYALDPRSW